MWECEYSKEPMDYRLIWLRFVRRIWIVVLGVLVGTVLSAGIHYYVKTAARGGRSYQAETVFYVVYAKDAQGVEYDYYNYYTWGDVIHTDYFMDAAEKSMDGALSKQELIADVAATVVSDVRYFYVRYTTGSPELSLKLAARMEEIVPAFAETKQEIERIEVATAADKVVDSTKLRMGNACFLGAGLGFVITVLGILIALTIDMGVYLPSTVEKRYHITCLGAPFMSEFAANWSRVTEGAKDVAMVLVDEKASVEWEPQGGINTVVCQNPVEHPEETDKIRSCERVILVLKAGCRNNKILERLLEQLGRQDIKPDAVILAMADERLILAYYRSGS